MRRLQVVLGHLTGHPQCRGEPAPEAAPCLSGASQVSAEDVVVVHGRRTAIGRGGRGGFKVRPRGPGAQWKTGGLRGLGSGPSAPEGAPLPSCDRFVSLGWGGGAGVPGTPCTGDGGSPRRCLSLQDTTPDELLSAVMTAVLRDMKLSPAQLGDICVGEYILRALWVSTPPRPPSSQSPPQTPLHPPGIF